MCVCSTFQLGILAQYCERWCSGPAVIPVNDPVLFFLTLVFSSQTSYTSGQKNNKNSNNNIYTLCNHIVLLNPQEERQRAQESAASLGVWRQVRVASTSTYDVRQSATDGGVLTTHGRLSNTWRDAARLRGTITRASSSSRLQQQWQRMTPSHAPVNGRRQPWYAASTSDVIVSMATAMVPDDRYRVYSWKVFLQRTRGAVLWISFHYNICKISQSKAY